MKARATIWRASVVAILSGVAVAIVLFYTVGRGWLEPALAGGPATVRLITAEQYLSTIHDVFGEDISVNVTFPPFQRRQGLLALGASALVITPEALEQFDRAARSIALQVVDGAHRSVLVPCVPASETEEDAICARQFFGRVGRRLYRRPLVESELARQVAVAGEVTEAIGDFYTGLAYSLAAMLASPKFLYISELTEPDPAHPGQVRLDAWSKASRLSFLLWNGPPDEALLVAAESGGLHEPRELEHHIERMLNSPRLEQGVRAFFVDMLSFDRFDTLSKDPVIYPVFTRSVAASAKEQALRLITHHLLSRNGDYRDLFTISHTFVDTTLGPLYQAPVSTPNDWVMHELDPDSSAGLLTSLGFLALHSHPGRSSATLRGAALREHLLCQKVPDPPPNVSFENFDNPDGQFKTLRELVTAHNADPVCAGCHKITDPPGLALENFDGAGQFRLKENDVVIDASGEIDGQAFIDVGGLGQAMRDHPALAPCLTSRWFAYGIGREVSTADRPWVAYITKRFTQHSYRVRDLLREIASNRAFFAVSGDIESGNDYARPQAAVVATGIP